MPSSIDPLTGESLEPQFEIIPLDALRWPSVCDGLAYWNGLRGNRRFPARSEVTPRGIAPLLANVILLKVIEGGADFEIAIAGDQVVRSYRTPLLHRRISALAPDMPGIAAWWTKIYRQVVCTGAPCAVRFSSGLNTEMKFSNAETVLLPLGPDGGQVDHIIGFTKREFMRLGSSPAP